jgi:hypothetical protein
MLDLVKDQNIPFNVVVDFDFDRNGLKQMNQVDEMFGLGAKILFNKDPVLKWPQLAVPLGK